MSFFQCVGRIVRVIVDPRVGFYLKAVILTAFTAWYLEYSFLDAFTVEETPLIRVESGLLKGRVATTRELKERYNSFQGIPYARPPLEDLRFMPPQPPEKWDEPLTAFTERNKCMQSGSTEALQNLLTFPTLRQFLLLIRSIPGIIRFVYRQKQESENCLYLNVYSPQLPTKNHHPKLPVMIWIHGGAFRIGSGDSDLYGPEFFMEAHPDEKVILVTGNYRLGPFGYLAYEEGGVPGNAGMRDQVAIMHWVKRNIAAFGGDPSRVTIFGESAGGTSVQMHLISPLSEGLFEGAISQSGSALNSRSSIASVRATSRARKLAMLLGIPVEGRTDREVVQKLKAAPAKSMARSSEKVLADDEKRGFEVAPFVPVIERGLTGFDRFLPDTTLNLLTKGKIAPVPYITGLNSQESIYLVNKWRTLNYTEVEQGFEKLVPADLGLPPMSQASKDFARKMKEFYFKGKPVSIDTINDLLNMYSDVFVCLVVHRAINIHIRRAPKDFFVYYFTYDSSLGFTNRILDNGLTGVSHGDELGSLFRINLLPAYPTAKDLQIVRRMVSYWTKFAHTGNPNGAHTIAETNVKWLPANTPQRPGIFLDIGAKARLGRDLLSDRMKFWNQFYSVDIGGGPH